MDLIEELKSYCDINNPVGALMLSGEWGSGKTYFIKKFIKSVKDKYVFVCISLFGIDSLDKLRVDVKKKWLEKASELDKLNGTKVLKIADSYKKVFGTIKEVLPENWQKKGEVVSSIMDLVNFVPISNRMSDKKVILVFDDLERSNISCTDLLGCINDYCENQDFNTIIIANEGKIKDSSKNELSYHEIKEKIVQRVIHFVPDYEGIVSDTIELMPLGIEYKGILRKNKQSLVKILSGEFNDSAIIERYRIENYKFGDNKKREEYQKEEKNLRKLLEQRPHNVRSFKCAIQDFERVYNKLVNAGIQDCTGIKKKGYIEELLKTVGLDTVGEKKTKHYSLGMKQRLGIALALVGEPDLLILDEPINGLDPQGIVEVRETIQKLAKERGMTICISKRCWIVKQ